MANSALSLIVVGIIIGLIGWWVIAKLSYTGTLSKERKKAIESSKQVSKGYVSEKVAPLLPIFPYALKDLVFIGKGFDYLVMKGLSRGNLEEVIFVEVKTGVSGLNSNERAIQSCIQQGKVRYECIRL
jgi:predicted Holliday junction resolvase-like endonuclease